MCRRIESRDRAKDLGSIQNGRCVAHFEPNQVQGAKRRAEILVYLPNSVWQDEQWIYFWHGLSKEFTDKEILQICEHAAHTHYEEHRVDYVDLKALDFDQVPYFNDDGEEVDYAGNTCPQCSSTESVYINKEDESPDSARTAGASHHNL